MSSATVEAFFEEFGECGNGLLPEGLLFGGREGGVDFLEALSVGEESFLLFVLCLAMAGLFEGVS